MLLEVVTRCYKRPDMLAANVASLQALLSPDWTQTLLVDDVGIGVPAANARLAAFVPHGDYVWVLDDDDLCVDRRLTVDLQRIVTVCGYPPAVIVRMDHGLLGILPDDDHWGQEPVSGRIGVSAMLTRRDVWKNCRAAWGGFLYAADFNFIHRVWCEHADHIVWHDTIASRVQRISKGAPEYA